MVLVTLILLLGPLLVTLPLASTLTEGLSTRITGRGSSKSGWIQVAKGNATKGTSLSHWMKSLIGRRKKGRHSGPNRLGSHLSCFSTRPSFPPKTLLLSSAHDQLLPRLVPFPWQLRLSDSHYPPTDSLSYVRSCSLSIALGAPVRPSMTLVLSDPLLPRIVPFPTFYFLLSSIYFLLSTFYFLLSAFYFLLSTFYFLLSTFYFLLSTFYFLL